MPLRRKAWPYLFGTGPRSIPGLILWLKGDLGVTSSGGSVSAWADQSGKGNNFGQATTAKQPTTSTAANGRACLAFSGSQALSNPGTPIPVGAKTIAWVFQTTTVTGSAYLSLCFKGPGNVFTEIEQVGTKWEFLADEPGGSTAAGPSTLKGVDTTPHTQILTYNGGTNTTVANYTGTMDGNVQTLATGGLSGQGATDLCSIGGEVSSANVIAFGHVGKIMEICVWDVVLTATQMQAVSQYLQGRWFTPFAPTMLPGLLYWFRSDMGITLGTGTNVAQWADQSGRGYNLSQVAAGQPTYVASGGYYGLPYVSFPGGASSVSLVANGAIAAAQPLDIFTVATTTASSPAVGGYLYDTATVPSNNLNVCLQSAGGLVVNQYDGTLGNGVTVTVNVPFQVETFFNTSFSYQTLNGVTKVATTNTGSAAPGNNLIIGNNGSYTTTKTCWNGPFYETFGYSRNLSTTELLEVNTYLNQRYGT